MKADPCCKTEYVKIIDWTPRQKKCTDREILLFLKALCGFFFPCSWFFLGAVTKSNHQTHATFFLARQLSEPALISEEEMEFPKTLAEQILKTVAGSHEIAVNPLLEGLLRRLFCLHSCLLS